MSILFDKLMNTIGEDEIIKRLGKPYFNILKKTPQNIENVIGKERLL